MRKLVVIIIFLLFCGSSVDVLATYQSFNAVYYKSFRKLPGSDMSWATLRGDGTANTDIANLTYLNWVEGASSNQWNVLYRPLICFDTSGINSSDTVTVASMSATVACNNPVCTNWSTDVPTNIVKWLGPKTGIVYGDGTISNWDMSSPVATISSYTSGSNTKTTSLLTSAVTKGAYTCLSYLLEDDRLNTTPAAWSQAVTDTLQVQFTSNTLGVDYTAGPTPTPTASPTPTPIPATPTSTPSAGLSSNDINSFNALFKVVFAFMCLILAIIGYVLFR